jgi:hypothetical protein
MGFQHPVSPKGRIGPCIAMFQVSDKWSGVMEYDEWTLTGEAAGNDNHFPGSGNTGVVASRVETSVALRLRLMAVRRVFHSRGRLAKSRSRCDLSSRIPTTDLL